MDKFNSNLNQLLQQIIKLFPEQSETINTYYEFNEETKDKYLLEFYNNCKTLGDDVSSKNEIIFSRENTILEKVDFFSIWNSEKLTDEYKENIWKYIHTMYILAYEAINDADLKSVLKHLKNLRASSEDLEHDSEILLNIVDSLTGKYTKDTGSKDSDSLDENEGDDMFKAPDIFNGMIGDLAKEIASEIDTSTIDIENPKQLLNDLLSGNFDEENDKSGITNLVKNITSKIQDKLASGTLDEGQLFGEAQNVINSLGAGGKMKSPMGDIFNTMMQNEFMPNVNNMGQDEKELFKNAQDLINNKGTGHMTSSKIQNNLSKMNNRDRLKKKLAEKKQMLAEKEKLLENNINNEISVVNVEEDLDALASEIEAIGSDKKSKNKKNQNVLNK